jgi:hypothetical protein
VNTQPSAQGRFADPVVSLYALAEDPVHVVCPACQGRAEVVPWLDGAPQPLLDFVASTAGVPRLRPRQELARRGQERALYWGCPVDPYFRQPLWLRADCCGGQALWAFNERHLYILESYVSARLRERGEYVGMTMLARLPAWLKSAKHRTEILRIIGRLRASLPQ